MSVVDCVAAVLGVFICALIIFVVVFNVGIDIFIAVGGSVIVDVVVAVAEFIGFLAVFVLVNDVVNLYSRH